MYIFTQDTVKMWDLRGVRIYIYDAYIRLTDTLYTPA